MVLNCEVGGIDFNQSEECTECRWHTDQWLVYMDMTSYLWRSLFSRKRVAVSSFFVRLQIVLFERSPNNRENGIFKRTCGRIKLNREVYRRHYRPNFEKVNLCYNAQERTAHIWYPGCLYQHTLYDCLNREICSYLGSQVDLDKFESTPVAARK